MVSGAWKLCRQPRNTALVGLELCLDDLSDVNVVVVVFHDRILRQKYLNKSALLSSISSLWPISTR